MIPKGNQRAGGQGLATHLLNAYDNDRVEVAEVRGAIAQDLHGAFAEWYAQAKATKCSKYLYSMSANPDHAQGPFTREHYYDFIRRTENSLGLSDQPRAVVFHTKHGREHCHVVWSRIDTEKMRAVQLSHDRQKLRTVAQEYARDHNLTLPPGMRKNRGKDRFPDHARTENLAEKQQEERTGISKKQRMDEITKAWRESPDARTFVKALADGGYILTRGDRRSYVVVDLYGEIHSLSRQLSSVKSRELKARLADYPIGKLPTAAEAQSRAREKRQALLIQNRQQEQTRQEPSAAERTAGTESAARQREALAKVQALRRADLDAKRQQLAERHSAERKALSDLQNARNADIVRDRAARQPKGVLALLARVTGFNALTAFRHNWQDRKRNREHRLQSAALARRHGREMENFKHQESGLTSLEKRERRSLETAVRRDVFRTIAAPAKTRTVAPALTPAQQARAGKSKQMAEEFRKASSARGRAPDSLELTPEQRAKIAAFRRTAAEISAPAKERADAGTAKKPPSAIAPAFNEAAGGKAAPPPGSLSEKFKDKAAGSADPRPRETKESAKEILKEVPKEMSEKARRALDLAKEFRERAGPAPRPKDHDREGHEEHYRRPPPDYSIRR